MKLVLTTRTDPETESILQELTREMDGQVERVTSWVVKTRDFAVRNALISMGWKPPKEDS